MKKPFKKLMKIGQTDNGKELLLGVLFILEKEMFKVVISWGLIVQLGIPSAIVAFLFKRFEKRQDDRDKSKQEFNFLLLKSIDATSTMGEATAEALVNGKCNGNLTKAREYNQKIKHERQEFMNRQGVAHII